MSKLLANYANMLEASVRTPERFPGRIPTPAELDLRLRVVALLRSLTPDEAVSLFRFHRHPERLATIAVDVGLSVEQCERQLAMVVWKFTEGLRSQPTRKGDPVTEPGG
jgi:hypothetical protein